MNPFVQTYLDAFREGVVKTATAAPKSAPKPPPSPSGPATIGTGRIQAKTAGFQEAGRAVDRAVADAVDRVRRFARRNPMAVAGGGAGLALGGLSGVVDPSRDETGARRSRTREALKRALMLGAVGAAGGHYADLNSTHPLLRDIESTIQSGTRAIKDAAGDLSKP